MRGKDSVKPMLRGRRLVSMLVGAVLTFQVIALPAAAADTGPLQPFGEVAVGAPSPNAVEVVESGQRRLSMIAPGNDARIFFAGASENGAHVFVSTAGGLIDGQSTPYLSLYDAIAGRFLPTGGHVYFEDVTPDGGHLLFTSTEALSPDDDDLWSDLYMSDGSAVRLVSVGADAPQMKAHYLADDGSRVIFSTRERLAASDIDDAVDLYLWDAATGAVTIASPGVTVDAGFGGASADGSRIVIDVFLDPSGTFNRLYELEAGSLVPIGQGAFHSISADNERLYFESEDPFVAGDLDEDWDAYELGPMGYRLLSDESIGYTSLVSVDATGTNWLMHVQESLTVDDSDSTQDLYLFDTAGGRLISAGSDGAYAQWVRSDLAVVLYATTSPLLPEDVDNMSDLYRWQATSQTVDLIPGTGTDGFSKLAAVNESGTRVIIETRERLVGGDDNIVADLYEWVEGDLALLSGSRSGYPFDVAFKAATADLERVFFQTKAKLLEADIDSSEDVYIADLDVTPPIPTIDGPESGSGADVRVRVGSVDDDAVWFDCQLDDRGWQRCGASTAFSGLDDGPHAVAVHAYDAAANRSIEPAIATWITGPPPDITPPVGLVTVAGGASFATASAVTVSVAATDGGTGLSQVALSNDGTTWTTRAYAPTQPWTLTPSNGAKTVSVKWKDAAGNWSTTKSDTIVLDTVAPIVTAPASKPVAGSTLSAGAVTLRVAWSGTDSTSGVARYELAQSTDGGAWSGVATNLTKASLDRALAPGHAFRFRVRAVDKAGNVGPWATGSTFTLSRYAEASSRIAYSGTWRTASSSVYWGSAAKYASTAGAKASFTFTGKSFAWIARRGPTRGRAEILVNGSRVATVDLYASAYQNQRVVWLGSWATAAKRTITIRVVGTSGRPRVDLDGVVTTT